MSQTFVRHPGKIVNLVNSLDKKMSGTGDLLTEFVCSVENGEVGKGDFIAVPSGNGWQAKVRGVQGVMSNDQLKIASIVHILPLKFAVRCHELCGVVVRVVK